MEKGPAFVSATQIQFSHISIYTHTHTHSKFPLYGFTSIYVCVISLILPFSSFWQSQSLLGAAPVISQEERDSHSQTWDCGAGAPRGASLLGRLFQRADRLTLKVWCYPQTCHLIQKKQALHCLVVPFQMEKKWENLGLFSSCLFSASPLITSLFLV